jgi:hypothetical protein
MWLVVAPKTRKFSFVYRFASITLRKWNIYLEVGAGRAFKEVTIENLILTEFTTLANNQSIKRGNRKIWDWKKGYGKKIDTYGITKIGNISKVQ